MIKKVYNPNCASVCFFRSSVVSPNYKVLLQITEKCNFRCAHCFVDSTYQGNEMSLSLIIKKVIPNFIESKVKKVTLTGGEPMVHKNIKEIVSALCENNISVSICTNGSLITDSFLSEVCKYENIHFNISLDGLRVDSHGKFRGNLSVNTYNEIINNIKKIGQLAMLNGILTTPNKYASIEEYDELCCFAKENHAKYILFNPLSAFGRGQETQSLAYTMEEMINLKNKILRHNDEKFEVVCIRFPNEEQLPLGECPLGSFPYVFTNGDLVICPYMAFSAQSNNNSYNYNDMVLYNIFENNYTIKESIQKYVVFNGMKVNDTSLTRRGCCASKISKDISLDSLDSI